LKENSIFYSPIENLIPTLYDLFSLSSKGFDKKIQELFEKGERKIKEHAVQTFLDGGKDSSTTR